MSPPPEQVSETGLPAGDREAERAMSLAGLELEVLEILKRIQKNWDTLSSHLDEVSLAGFRLQLLEILSEDGQNPGSLGRNPPRCPWPALFCNKP